MALILKKNLSFRASKRFFFKVRASKR
uniref:Uncharacterized protein n=1 Tax=Arundo donax TaxID=35708 RepID=A0A0A9CAW7_ARUDO